MSTNPHPDTTPNHYMAADDMRLLAMQRAFEEVLNRCPQEWNGWQTVKMTRKADVVYVEVVSSFRISMASKTG